MEKRDLATEVTEVNEHSTLKLKFDCGLTSDGKTITKTRSFSNVKSDATSLDVYNVAETLASLQKHTLTDVIKKDNTILN